MPENKAGLTIKLEDFWPAMAYDAVKAMIDGDIEITLVRDGVFYKGEVRL